MTALRLRAREVVDELARRLATASPQSSDLAGGSAGISLLYTTLGDAVTAHKLLAHTVADPPDPRQGLFHGLAGVAFAAQLAGRESGSYGNLLAKADSHIEAAAAELARADKLSFGFDYYDVIAGLAGLGRYLLLRGRSDALRAVLAALVALTKSAGELPGWWVNRAPSEHASEDRYARGHANLGLAHGIPGPLALLSLAWSDGHRLPGQVEAIHTIVEWLLRYRIGTDWPADLSHDEATGVEPKPTRSAWCYGTPGVATAILLAGKALEHPGWERVAAECLTAALSDPSGIRDFSLCHGWAGLLTIALETGIGPADELAACVLEGFQPELDSGYEYYGASPPGLLEGAAGVALALHCYTDDSRPTWPAALLVR